MPISRSVRLSRKGQLVIPQEMRDALGLREGDELVASLEEGRVVLEPPEEDRFFVRSFFAFCKDLLRCVTAKAPPAGASPPWLRPKVRVRND